eukprot:4910773-Prymnesium_polylepis.1
MLAQGRAGRVWSMRCRGAPAAERRQGACESYAFVHVLAACCHGRDSHADLARACARRIRRVGVPPRVRRVGRAPNRQQSDWDVRLRASRPGRG